MTKPHLCLALSLSLSLAQASFYAVDAAPDMTSVEPNSSSKAIANKASIPVSGARPIGRTINGVKPHSLLVLPVQKAPLAVAADLPAAALTIHSSLGNDQSVDSGNKLPTSRLVAGDAARIAALKGDMVASAGAETAPQALAAGEAKNLLAQLAPDRLISQADTGGVSVTPIPPVVTGTVDLEEFKTSNVIDLKVSQSRTFKLKNKIVRTSISDPGIAEPVVVAENQIVLLGKTAGTATLVLWDDAGNSVAIDLRVSRDYSGLQAALREIDPRIIVKPFSVSGTDRVLLMGDVDHAESVIRAMGTANVFMDDRGFNVQIANNRLTQGRVGEAGGSGGGGGGGGGQLSAIGNVDRYTFFSNINNNVSKAQVITSDGGRVTSLIKVRKVPLIVLHVTFLEVNSAAARDLGMQLGLAFTGNHFSFAMGGNSSVSNTYGFGPPFNQNQIINLSTGVTAAPYTVTSPLFVSQASMSPSTIGTASPTYGFGQGVLNVGGNSLINQSVLFGAPGGASFGVASLQNVFTSLASIQNGSSGIYGLQPTIQGIITHSRARILAEPTLVTISGERASFLAGGEIPIISAGATGGATAQSVNFEPFGLRINMIPVLLENGSINLQVAPEERIVDSEISLIPSSLTTPIPGFTTRKTQTIVEMKPGQELFIAGLLSTNNGRDIVKTPILGEIPVLGALYRSKSFNKNESELVVAIRPEIILPGLPGQLKLPEEIGRVEGPRDTNLFQVEPTVLDERHYTSGRSERYQKTSPTLPEGSPVPDNE
jgi:Flp pilus assembly secretin CpaC